jgi:hypothetical protein
VSKKQPLDPLTAEVIKKLQDGTYVIQKVDRQTGLGYDKLTIEASDASTLWKPAPVSTALGPRSSTGVQGAAGSVGVPGATGVHVQTGATGPISAVPYPTSSRATSHGSLRAASHPIPPPLSGTEPIIGFRDFMVADSVTGFVLMSRNKTLWRQRERSMAYCNGNIYAPHDAPYWDCECGIYAFSTPTHQDLKATDVAWAEIAMWGEVLVCDHGYRAQYAYPLSIFLKDTKTLGIKRVRDELEAGYGVPVFLVAERDGKTAADVMGEMITRDLNKREETIAKKLQMPITDDELRRMWDGPVD